MLTSISYMARGWDDPVKQPYLPSLGLSTARLDARKIFVRRIKPVVRLLAATMCVRLDTGRAGPLSAAARSPGPLKLAAPM